jgi:Dullard-like phosphatase family protein
MNSISYLDSVLTRSLTSSRSGSGSSTPLQDGKSGTLGRRASDYSLSRERERERRRIAVSLGLSPLDADAEREPSKKRKSSKRSSRSSSVKGSDNENSSDRKSFSHPKFASEDANASRKAKLHRTESTPAPLTRSDGSNARWGGLWGLGGWLDGSESRDAYTRRDMSSSYDSISKPFFDRDASDMGARGQRRASTSDANAVLAGISPESLLSEREKENVVAFEGYDPEEDLVPGPGSSAPPSTPFPTGSSTPTNDRPAKSQKTGISTGSRISSLLFGALNPLTDDYFGPQPAAGSTPPLHRRKKSEDGTTSGERRRRKSTKSDDLSAAKTYAEEKSLLLQLGDKDGQASKDMLTGLPSEPPPPYSDVASSASLLLPSPSLDSLHARSSSKEPGSRRRQIFTVVFRGVQVTLGLLRRLVVTILLLPVRIVRYYRRLPVASQKVVVEVSREEDVKRRLGALKEFQTSAQADRPVAARHVAGRRRAEISESSDSEEVVTEEQAEERAKRLAAREKAAAAEEEAAVEQKTLQVRKGSTSSISGRLLPNPHPIDPLLAHDRHAKPLPMSLVQTLDRPKVMQHDATINRGPLSSLIHHSPKVLVLDLDETLIHSTSRSPTWSALTDKSRGQMAVTTGGGLLGLEGLGGMMGLQGQVGVRPHQVEVVLDGRSIIYHVYKRPHVDHFLRKVAAWYHVVVFTASVQEYADPVIDWIDQGRGLVGTRLYRESCTFRNGSYLKNLAHVDADLSRVCLVDNSPASYLINQANGIPIEGWTHDPNDEALLDLLPVLDSLRFASDVRHILGLRGFLDSKQQQITAKQQRG